jgi:hypothetical protein
MEVLSSANQYKTTTNTNENISALLVYLLKNKTALF